MDEIAVIKDNQPETLRAIQELFAPEPCVAGFSPASHDDFRRAEKIDKGHGRIEKRVITPSAALQDYVDWPQAAQVLKLERSAAAMTNRVTRCAMGSRA